MVGNRAPSGCGVPAEQYDRARGRACLDLRAFPTPEETTMTKLVTTLATLAMGLLLARPAAPQ